MYCPKCGAFIPEGTQSCPSCNEVINTYTANNTAENNYPNNGVYYTPQDSGAAYNNTSQQSNDSYYNQQSNNNYYNNPEQNNSHHNYFNQGQTGNQGYYRADMPNYNEMQIRNIISNANTLGILAIVLGILFTPIAGIICGAIGLSKLNSLPNIPLDPILSRERDKTKKMNILGIVIPIVLYIIAIIFMIIMFTVMGFATASAIDFM